MFWPVHFMFWRKAGIEVAYQVDREKELNMVTWEWKRGTNGVKSDALQDGQPKKNSEPLMAKLQALEADGDYSEKQSTLLNAKLPHSTQVLKIVVRAGVDCPY